MAVGTRGDWRRLSLKTSARACAVWCNAMNAWFLWSRFVYGCTLWLATGQRPQPVPPSIDIRLGSAFCVSSWGLNPLRCLGRARKVLSYVHGPKRVFPHFLAPLGKVRQSLRLTQTDTPGALRGAACSEVTGRQPNGSGFP